MVAFPLPGQFVKRSLDQEIARLAGVRPILTVSLARNQAWLRGRAMPADAVPGRSHTRASTAYGTTRDGRLISYASGAARDVPGRGQLDEVSRTNLHFRSQEFDNGSWVKSNITVTADQIAAPDGTLTADKIEAGAGAGGGAQIYQSQLATATTHVFSIYVHKGSGATDANTFGVRNNTTATTLLLGTINFDTGAFTYSTGSSGVSVEVLADGWYRLIFVVSSGITIGDGLRCYAGFSGAVETPGEFCYAWGSQLEAGAFVTSYIPTTTASATRAADVATIDLLNPGLYDVSGQPELASNGSFASDTGWTKGTGWTISGGVANASAVPAGASGYLLANGATAAAGKVYLATFTVTLAAGGVGFRVGDTSGVSRTSSGTYTEVLRCSAASVSTGIGFERRGADFTGTIDNVSIKEIPAEQVIDYPCTIIARYERAVDTGGIEVYLSLGDSTNNDRATLYVGSSDTANAYCNSGGVGQADVVVSGSVPVGASTRYAARIAANDVRAVRDGVLSGADTLVTLPASPREIRLGALNGSSWSCGYLSEFSIVRGGLSDPILQSLARAA